MEFAQKLNNSLKLLENFELAVNVPNNNKNILDCVEAITLDMDQYKSKENFDSCNSENTEVSTTIKEIIKKIDNLNKIVLPKSELSNKFSDFNTLK
tara:strand:+ start:801 stop:1088 length:288 start_codon:yes stop_codon:yes gene_type:complete